MTVTTLWKGSLTTSRSLRHVKIMKDSVSGKLFIRNARFFDIRFDAELSRSDLYRIARTLIRDSTEAIADYGLWDFGLFDRERFMGLGILPVSSHLYVFLKMILDVCPAGSLGPLQNFFNLDSLSQSLGLFDGA